MRLCLIFFLFIVPFISLAQRKKLPGPPTKAEELLAEKRDQCLNSHRFNVKQRRAFFPFNSAVTVKLVSFSDTVRIYAPIAVNHFDVSYDKILESKTLSQKGLDSLTDIFYNVGYTPVKASIYIADPGASCYNPRNAILFINASGDVTQYIEFCFECHRYYLSSSKIKNTEYCEQKYEMLKHFFLKQGIQYGTILPKSE